MKGTKEDCRLQAAVEYLTGYTGVIGAVLADYEGLVVACSPPSLMHGEKFAALGPEIFHIADRIMGEIIKPGCRHISLKTEDRWMTVAAALNFCLVVLADQKADDLLNVRIQRALEMIANYIKEKYPAEIYSARPEAIKKEEAMEASHV